MARPGPRRRGCPRRPWAASARAPPGAIDGSLVDAERGAGDVQDRARRRDGLDTSEAGRPPRAAALARGAGEGGERMRPVVGDASAPARETTGPRAGVPAALDGEGSSAPAAPTHGSDRVGADAGPGATESVARAGSRNRRVRSRVEDAGPAVRGAAAPAGAPAPGEEPRHAAQGAAGPLSGKGGAAEGRAALPREAPIAPAGRAFGEDVEIARPAPERRARALATRVPRPVEDSGRPGTGALPAAVRATPSGAGRRVPGPGSRTRPLRTASRAMGLLRAGAAVRDGVASEGSATGRAHLAPREAVAARSAVRAGTSTARAGAGGPVATVGDAAGSARCPVDPAGVAPGPVDLGVEVGEGAGAEPPGSRGALGVR